MNRNYSPPISKQALKSKEKFIFFIFNIFYFAMFTNIVLLLMHISLIDYRKYLLIYE